MDKPWFMFEICVPFGNTNFNVAFGGAHDLDIGAPPNYPVTALLPGTIVSVTKPPPDWGEQVGVELDEPFNGIPFMAYLHLSAVNPALPQAATSLTPPFKVLEYRLASHSCAGKNLALLILINGRQWKGN